MARRRPSEGAAEDGASGSRGARGESPSSSAFEPSIEIDAAALAANAREAARLVALSLVVALRGVAHGIDGQLFALGGWVSFIFFWLGMAWQLRSVSPTDAVAIQRRSTTLNSQMSRNVNTR